jgi:hypothetical protein
MKKLEEFLLGGWKNLLFVSIGIPITKVFHNRSRQKGGLWETYPIRWRREPTSYSDAAGRLFACSFPPFYSPQALDFTMSFLEEIVQAVSCWELSFLPHEGVLQLIMK